MSAHRPLEVLWMGRIDYPDAHALQTRLVEEIASGDRPDTLLLLEHEPVLTCGRGTDAANLREASHLPVFQVERGGDVTWHGPGQLVGYPILRLQGSERDLHRHLRNIEDLLLHTCRDLGCPSGRRPPHTGVWTPPDDPVRKVASIGVAVRHWTTWHGFALNVAVDPVVFAGINPCGLEASVMTSLQRECVSPPDLATVIEVLFGHLGPTLDRLPRMVSSRTHLQTV